MSIDTAFPQDVRNVRGRGGRCHKCRKATAPEERVLLQIGAVAVGPPRKNLVSKAKTYCASCARHVFDAIVDGMEENTL